MKLSCLFLAGLSCSSGTLLSKAPLELPENYDPIKGMIYHVVDGKRFHQPREAVRWSEQLLKNGTTEDIAVAQGMLEGALQGQVREPGHPHFGAFRWELEMEHVEDLNAVEFVLYSLIPILRDYGHLLSEGLREEIRQCIRLGLENIRRMDVGLNYTNIVLKDITNSILGGELLGDPKIAARGYEKFSRWLAYTNQSGHPYEFNSTPYTAVSIDVLSQLARWTTDPATKVRAKVALSRLGLSAGLHMHGPTQRWAGPHGRAYHGSVIGKSGTYLLQPAERKSYAEWIENGKLPRWMHSILEGENLPAMIFETTGREDGIGISTYKADTYSFGVATRNLSNQANRYIAWQTNSFSIHYTHQGDSTPRSIYTRYLLDEHWLGYFSAGTGRGSDYLIPDEGRFQGIQDRERAIALYAPAALGALQHHSGAKAAIAVARWNSDTDSVWINGKTPDRLPVYFDSSSTVVFASGSILLAIKPFSLTNLGGGGSLGLVQRDDTLVLELYNYRGPRKTFWELAWPGEFYQGVPQCGFYAEVARQSDWPNPAAFSAAIESGQITDLADPPSTYTGTEKRRWKVGYARDGRSLELNVDLFDWSRSAEGYINGQRASFPMLESPNARQSREGHIQVGSAVLRTLSGQPATLYHSTDGLWTVALYHGLEPGPLHLEWPGGSLEIPSMGTGLVVCGPDGVRVEAVDRHGKIKLSGATLLDNLNEIPSK